MNVLISRFRKDGLSVDVHLTGTPETAQHCAFVSAPDFIRVDEIGPEEFAYMEKMAAERACNKPPYGKFYAEIYHGMIK